jgi:hypothetical protein
MGYGTARNPRSETSSRHAKILTHYTAKGAKPQWKATGFNRG